MKVAIFRSTLDCSCSSPPLQFSFSVSGINYRFEAAALEGKVQLAHLAAAQLVRNITGCMSVLYGKARPRLLSIPFVTYEGNCKLYGTAAMRCAEGVPENYTLTGVPLHEASLAFRTFWNPACEFTFQILI